MRRVQLAAAALGVGVLAGLVVFIAVAAAFRMQELSLIAQLVRSKVRR